MTCHRPHAIVGPCRARQQEGADLWTDEVCRYPNTHPAGPPRPRLYHRQTGGLGLIGLLLLGLASGAAAAESVRGCPPAGKTLQVGFYAHFEPVSYSADPDPAAAGFDVHLGYEADLLTALEAIEGANLSFTRHGISAWEGIWLLPAGPQYDIVGGGITILESRTRDADGRAEIVFTAGHLEFRQSLLVRAADAERLGRHQDLSSADRVGVVAGTTGEARLLELTGITDAAGVLAAGTRVATAAGATLVADGSAAYAITAATPGLGGRRQLQPASSGQPQLLYFGDELALIEALAGGRVDAVARGEIGNRATARSHGGAFVVTALDSRAETGGFALAAAAAELAACLDRLIAHLTDHGRIGYREWLAAPPIFLWRAGQWPGAE